MDMTFAPVRYAVAPTAKIQRQLVTSYEIVPVGSIGEVRSIPAGVDTASPSKRYRTEEGRELPVETDTSAGPSLVKLPQYALNRR